MMGGRFDTRSSITAATDIPPPGLMAGRQFTISWNTGDDSARFKWNHKGPQDNPEKDHLPSRITEYLAEHCLPQMPNGKLPCFTEFISVNNDRYRAHPSILYNGRPWNDKAMVKWENIDEPLPAFIHTFVDLRGLPEGASLHVRSTGQTNIKAGSYAVIHSFSPVDEAELSYANVMIGRYNVYRHTPGGRPPLYLVDIESIRSPTVGIRDIGWSREDGPHRHHLFLIRRKEDWALSWDAMIKDLARGEDDPSLEGDYEEAPNSTAEDPPQDPLPPTPPHRPQKRRRNK